MDEREQFAMNIYLSENPNRKQDDWEYQGSARIIYFQQADRLIAEGFSRRPELSVDTLVRLNAELCLGLELNTIHTICTKFTAPEAKQSIDMKNLRFEIHRLVSLNVSNVAEVAITIKEIFDYLNDIES